MTRLRNTVLAGSAVVFIGLGTVAFGLPPASAVGEDFGPGPCEGPLCPGTFPPPGNNVDEGYRDEAVNVYAGQDIRISGEAAEMEGKVVTPGDFSLDKQPAAIFNVGVAGVGSRVSPPEGSDYLTVGGDLNVNVSNTLAADRGVIRIAGSQTGGGTARDEVVVDPEAADEYANANDVLSGRSQCLATQTPNGTVDVTDSTVTFTGDGESDLQIFETDESLQSSTGGSVGFSFRGIPDDATVPINLSGDDDITVNTYSGDLTDQDPWNQLRDRLLWNVPNADSFAMHGPAQFQGSLLAGSPENTTTLATAGFNGRLFTVGTLLQTLNNAGGQGGEVHNYPFTGVLPSCETPPPDPDPDADTDAEADPDADADSEADPNADAVSEATSDDDAGTDPDADTTADVDAQADPEADTTADANASSDPEATADVDAGTDPEADTTADVDAGSDPDASADEDAGADPDATSDEEAEADSNDASDPNADTTADDNAATDPAANADSTGGDTARVDPDAGTSPDADSMGGDNAGSGSEADTAADSVDAAASGNDASSDSSTDGSGSHAGGSSGSNSDANSSTDGKRLPVTGSTGLNYSIGLGAFLIAAGIGLTLIVRRRRG